MLTAVEEFSNRQDSGPVPATAGSYRQLLPLTAPSAGQQYAFEVDLDRCSGCKACVAACHSLNGLDDDETWRDVGLLIGGTTTDPIMQHVTSACHHCIEPGCLKGCPVNAYEKDPQTGIVKHLDDQCIGCQYCTLMCPYDVPKYHSGKGIVRKCDMCSDRLAVGEAPACVQACPHQAIAITTVDTEHVVENAEADPFLPAAPDPQITLPTTHFKTSRVFPRNALPADYYNVNPQHPHPPLIVMLVLTQLSVGAIIVGWMLDAQLSGSALAGFRQLQASSALAFGLLALASSTFHLGRPQYAFRAVLGLQHSWLSREILAFGVFAKIAIALALVCWLWPDSRLIEPLQIAVAAVGMGAIGCSAMIYTVTLRECWSLGRTAAKFAMSAAVLGIAATWLTVLAMGYLVDTVAAHELAQQTGPLLMRSLIAAMSAKLLFEYSILRHLGSRRNSPLKRSAALMVGPLSSSTLARLACGILGGIVMPLFLVNEIRTMDLAGIESLIVAGMLFAACLSGELLERYQFFAACAAPRMPGRLSP